MRLLVLAGLLIATASAASAADAAKGKEIFKTCAACHADLSGGGDLGPSLVGVVGRKVGTREDYRYSAPMSRASFVWDEQKLKAYIHDPQSTVKGTRMPFGGIEDQKEIDDLFAYLVTQK